MSVSWGKKGAGGAGKDVNGKKTGAGAVERREPAAGVDECTLKGAREE